MSCRAEQQRRTASAARALRSADHVVAVDRVPPEQDPTATFALDVVLGPEAGGVPHGVAGLCARYGLSIRRVQSQGSHWQALLTA